MPRSQIDMRRLLKMNQGVDAKQFAEAMRILDELKKQGVKRHEFSLIQPFTRHYHDNREDSV